jgi:hypothetical protein
MSIGCAGNTNAPQKRVAFLYALNRLERFISRLSTLFTCITGNALYNQSDNNRDGRMIYNIEKQDSKIRIVTTAATIYVYDHKLNDRMTEIMGARFTEVKGTLIGEYDRKQDGYTVREIKQKYTEAWA